MDISILIGMAVWWIERECEDVSSLWDLLKFHG